MESESEWCRKLLDQLSPSPEEALRTIRTLRKRLLEEDPEKTPEEGTEKKLKAETFS